MMSSRGTPSGRAGTSCGVVDPLAIGVIWAAVTVTAIFGPDLVTVNGSGTNTTTVPSAVVVALFATIATWIVARYGFRRGGDDS